MTGELLYYFETGTAQKRLRSGSDTLWSSWYNLLFYPVVLFDDKDNIINWGGGDAFEFRYIIYTENSSVSKIPVVRSTGILPDTDAICDDSP